jgi:transcriptional regulator NrdR family protein
MKCPHCEGDQTAVIDTTKIEGVVYRYRSCRLCFRNFKSKEEVFVGPIPKKARNKGRPEQKQFQKQYDSKSITDIWK